MWIPRLLLLLIAQRKKGRKEEKGSEEGEKKKGREGVGGPMDKYICRTVSLCYFPHCGSQFTVTH